MKKTLKNTLISVMSLGVIGLLTSCPNPNGAYPESTNWFFVNQSEVDKLLNSPEIIEFEGKKYKLNISFYDDQYRPVRPCPSLIFFSCDSSVLSSKRKFIFYLSNPTNDIDINVTDVNRLKATNLWIINTNNKFYFSNKEIIYFGNNLQIFYAPTNYTFTVNTDETLKDGGVAIMRFETKEKDYFIKTSKILKGQQL